MARWIGCLSALVVPSMIIAGCGGGGERESRVTEGVQTFSAEGFAIDYPLHAKLEKEPLDSGMKANIRIIGPEVSIRPVDVEFSFTGPSYEVDVIAYDNPRGQSGFDWARERIMNEWRQARMNDEPTGSLPVSEDGKTVTGDSVTVAGLPAFRTYFFAGDSETAGYYVANDKLVVMLSYSRSPVENMPVALAAQDIAAMILATFRFD